MDCVKLIFFMLYPFLCQLALSSSSPHLCPKDEALALLQFKHMFTVNPNASDYCYDITDQENIQSYPRTLSWNNSIDCCSWNGVHCDETTGQVIELDLRCSQLQGKFHSNSSLFHLSNLKSLDLAYNNFSGSLISPKFGEFSGLAHLDLSHSSFTGLIPAEISHLSKLHILRIGDQHELSLGPHNFELLLKNLTQLRELHLESVNISSTIPSNFSSHLTTLQLSDTQLRGILPERVLHLSNLETLILSYNNFHGQLEFLSFNRSWTRLELLDFSSNSLTGPVPSNVSGLQNLLWLSLSSNHLNGTIPSWIFSLPSLKVLDLSNNTFRGKIQEFKSKTLSIVTLKENQLEGPIPNSLLNTPSLRILLLSHNNISGQIASTICNLTALNVLNLRSNNLEGTIPQCLGKMNICKLDLSNNSLSGTINTNFSIGNQLRVISLHGNKLTGKVPRSLINCKYLTLLDLGNNQLNDTFPNWFGDLPHLQIFSLRSNKFHGPIKSSGNTNLFAQLQILDLSSNGFSGNLPISLFGNLQAMKKIDESTTPHYVSDQYVGYYDYLTTITTKGQDYDSVQILDSNMIIDLSKNRFEGHIPGIIGDLVGLRTLNLSHNVLEGHIPTSLQNLSVLESLDLSSNKISGEIPKQLESLTFLEVLNLSRNHLVGCIPTGKQFDSFENSSYQGNDGLHGFPLSTHCGGDDRVPPAITPAEIDQEEEEDSPMISWEAVLMGYGCGLVIGLSVIYIMWSTQYPAWFSRLVVKLEHKITMRMKRHEERY